MYKIENGQEIPIDEVPGDGYILNNKTNINITFINGIIMRRKYHPLPNISAQRQ